MSQVSFAIKTEGLTKRFGERIAVSSVDLNVRSGSAFGLLGPNGAGKTTLIRLLVGLATASEGKIDVLGHSIPEEKQEALSRVGAIVEEPRFHPFMTGRENLEIVASLRGKSQMANIDDSLVRVGLMDRAGDKVGGYSLGMRQRLGLARCLLVDPELMVLDEPMNGLDPPGILEIRGLIRSFVSEGKTVLISSHLLDEVEKTCDEVAILAQGSVLASGSLESILSGNNGEVVLRTSSDDAAIEELKTYPNIDSIRREVNGLRLTLKSNGTGIDQVLGQITRSIVLAGLDVFEVSQQKVSLESRFFEFTGTEDKEATFS